MLATNILVRFVCVLVVYSFIKYNTKVVPSAALYQQLKNKNQTILLSGFYFNFAVVY
jgi:hypothetical protein